MFEDDRVWFASLGAGFAWALALVIIVSYQVGKSNAIYECRAVHTLADDNAATDRE